jgi:8-oxo-dGTP pyrophosphatase MutT (NUDIX family)
VKPSKAVGIQYAALPYRVAGRRVEVLLITSRETRRWVIPKGWPIRGVAPQDVAAMEAEEEAGITGEVDARSVGSFRYMKQVKANRTIAVQVIVFPLLVLDQKPDWKEQGQRQARWLPYARAAGAVSDVPLKRLILEFGKAKTPGLLTGLGGLRPLLGQRLLARL